jgi:uncharacterized protein GlcG (DUF336 family)
MSIAVADEGGNLVSHIRMDDAWLGSIDISQADEFPPKGILLFDC